jgi:anti-anti-sigma factor
MNTFSATLRKEDQMVVIDLEGSIDARADEDFNQVYTTADSLDYDTIALNFSEVDYINSTGIALIVELLAQARKSHKHLVVYGLSEHYIEVFQITRLSDFMDVYEDETNAKTSVLSG